MKPFFKTFLQAFGVGGLCAFVGLLIWSAIAQPASTTRLRDLGDVRIATNPTDGAALVYSTAAKRWTNGTASGGGSTNLAENSFTTNSPGKFPLLLAAPGSSSNWFVVIHIDGAGNILESPKFYGNDTNLSWNGRFSADSGAFTNGLKLNGVSVLTNAQTGSANLTNWSALATSAKQDALGYTPLNVANNFSDVANAATARANIGATVSINGTNVTTPNLQDTATVTLAISGSNITATAVASGGSLSVNGTNATTPNLKDGSDVTWSITSASNAVPAFAAQTWNALAYTGGTNVVMDCSLGNSYAAHYKLTLTGATWMSLPTSIPTTPKFFYIFFQQPSTGTVVVGWSNVFKWPGGTAPIVNTNGSAQSLVLVGTGPFTNGVLNGFPIVPQIQ